MTATWEPVEAEGWNGAAWVPVVAERFTVDGWQPLAIERCVTAPGAVTLDRLLGRLSESTAARVEVPIFGDSTTIAVDDYADPEYSWVLGLSALMAADGYPYGGKGIAAGQDQGIGFDAPEVNAFTPATLTWGATTDGYDFQGGAFLNTTTPGLVQPLDFRGTCFRLWTIQRGDAAPVSYQVDGGSWVAMPSPTVPGDPVPRFVFVDGLTEGLHTVAVRHDGTGAQRARVALAGMRDTGVVLHRHAVSGRQMKDAMVTGVSCSWGAMGLTYNGGPRTNPSSYAIDTTHPVEERVNPGAAILHLMFNDLTSDPDNAAATATTGVRVFAAMCQAANIDGIVVSGQLPNNENYATHGEAVFNALRDTAAAESLAFVDFWAFVAPATGYTSPHLPKFLYQQQAQGLWDYLVALG